MYLEINIVYINRLNHNFFNMQKSLIFFIAFMIAGFSFLNPLTAQVTSTSGQTGSITVEDGGTGPYKAIMITENTLQTHTVFRPKDLSVFGENNKLPIIAWGNGA